MEKPLRNPQRFGLDTYSFSDGNALVVHIGIHSLGRIPEHKADIPHHIPLIFLHTGGLAVDCHLVAWGKPQPRLRALKVQVKAVRLPEPEEGDPTGFRPHKVGREYRIPLTALEEFVQATLE